MRSMREPATRRIRLLWRESEGDTFAAMLRGTDAALPIALLFILTDQQAFAATGRSVFCKGPPTNSYIQTHFSWSNFLQLWLRFSRTFQFSVSHILTACMPLPIGECCVACIPWLKHTSGHRQTGLDGSFRLSSLFSLTAAFSSSVSLVGGSQFISNGDISGGRDYYDLQDGSINREQMNCSHCLWSSVCFYLFATPGIAGAPRHGKDGQLYPLHTAARP